MDKGHDLAEFIWILDPPEEQRRAGGRVAGGRGMRESKICVLPDSQYPEDDLSHAEWQQQDRKRRKRLSFLAVQGTSALSLQAMQVSVQGWSRGRNFTRCLTN